jgi:4-hydroxy-3-polyprenylbenzoate decarboxylase
MKAKERKIIVAVSGASGAIYALKLLLRLKAFDTDIKETAVVFSDNAKEIWEFEIGTKYQPLGAEKEYSDKDFYAPFASGSSKFETMIICPASMGMIGRIANGISNDLISRSADVMLKERRTLILVPREAPYNLIHINNMKLLIEAGAVICPATPSFYNKPETIDDLVLSVVDRILDLAGFDVDAKRWGD